ncbi:MAG: prolyl oligopeptidase family serine peptidase [Paludibacter sp.]|nr:prolyl oligopeptidase family serine peptidase [Paludibacter sp.]MDD4429112.1 prolyl oligopeptidase family serine peptidase [Paludibacter sp.]
MHSCTNRTNIEYPETRKDTIVDNYWGTSVSDPYRWLENDRSEETEAWVIAQNQVTYSYLEKIPFRNKLKERFTELMNYPKYSSPKKVNNKYYFYKNDGLQNQSVLYELDSLTAEPKVLLDPNKLSTDGTVALSQASFSKDGKYLAYSIAKSGSDWNEIFVMEIATRNLLSDHIEWVKFSGISWQGDGFYYSAYSKPETGKEYSNKNEYQKVFYHKIGQTQDKDNIIYENKQFALRNCGAVITEDEKFLFISENESTSGNSLLMKDLTKANAKPVLIAPGFKSDFDVIDHYQGKIYVLTNYKAPNQQLMVFDPAKPQLENWQTLVPETKNVLGSASIIGGKLFLNYLQDASHHLLAYNTEGKQLFEVKLPTIGTVGISGNMDDNEAFYTFTSYTFPPTIYRYDVAENKAELFRKSEVAFNSEDYISEQVFYTSKDGTKVPMSITYKKGMKKNGKNPVMLYGYGGFNISLLPGFSAVRIPFLEKGGIYAIANLRGGGEYGELWHKAGTKMQKQNVFDDFIAAAAYLIAEKYTNPKKLAINGGSNGGLLIGACMTQRPDLFAVAIPEVGVLDMLRYQKFTIGWAWATDYGKVEDSKEMFEYLLGYSPLHNLKKGTNYPATLITTGDHDDRVVPAHSFKFAATLQAANSGKNPTLIRIDVNAGHGAGKPISKIIDAQTDVWAFVMQNLGMRY